MKKFAALMCIISLSLPVFAGFQEHYELGQKYLTNFQYSGAITEFKSALRINYLDNSARINLINAYCSRGLYYATKENDYSKAADDYRAALFYLIYYPTANQAKNSTQAIVQVTSNLNKCLSAMDFDTSAKNRYEKAKQLRAEGEFAAAGYEFNQALGDTAYIKDSFQQIGDIMKLLGNEGKAVEYYKKAVAVSPNDVQLRMSYAKILDKQGQEEDAVTEYNYVLSKTTDNKDLLYSLERIYKRKLEESPNDANIASNLGAIMQKQGNYDEALKYYSKAEYLDPSNVTTRINVGTLYQQKGDYRTAITAYDSVLILFPDNTEANLYKAQCLTKLGKSKEASDLYKKLLTKDPNNEIIQNEMIASVRDTMSMQEFVEYVKKNSPNNSADILYNYALDLHKQSKINDAITMYSEVLKIKTDNPEVYVNLAIAQGQNQKYDDAIKILESAKTKFANNSQIEDALKNLTAEATNIKLDTAAKYYNDKNYESAIAEYLAIKPATSDTMLGVASSYQNMGDNGKAIEYYIKAFELAPTNSDIAYYIAALYAEKEDIQNAKTYAEKSLALNRTNKPAKELLDNINTQISSQNLEKAISLFDEEKYDESLEILNKLISADSKNSYALYYRGMIYDTKKKYWDSITDYKKAISLNPDLAVINYLIGVDYDMLEKYKEAMNYYKSFTATYSEDDDFLKYAKNRIDELAPYVK